jgi:hypothetical protein
MASGPYILGDLKRTYRYQGKYYGPGLNVKIPAGLAATLGIQAKSEAPKRASASKEKAPTGDGDQGNAGSEGSEGGAAGNDGASDPGDEAGAPPAADAVSPKSAKGK